MSQAEKFLEGEGDAWLQRNRANLGQHDVVSRLLDDLNIVPTNVLEVGCANGWLLAKLRDKYGCKVLGVEPSGQACIEAAAEYSVPVLQTTAETMVFAPKAYDLVIFGFCLYLTEPCDWLQIAANADRVLAPGGYLIIHDFDAPFPFARPYSHLDGVLSYHFDFAQLWLAHPLYSLIHRHLDGESVTILRKLPAHTLKEIP